MTTIVIAGDKIFTDTKITLLGKQYPAEVGMDRIRTLYRKCEEARFAIELQLRSSLFDINDPYNVTDIDKYITIDNLKINGDKIKGACFAGTMNMLHLVEHMDKHAGNYTTSLAIQKAILKQSKSLMEMVTAAIDLYPEDIDYSAFGGVVIPRNHLVNIAKTAMISQVVFIGEEKNYLLTWDGFRIDEDSVSFIRYNKDEVIGIGSGFIATKHSDVMYDIDGLDEKFFSDKEEFFRADSAFFDAQDFKEEPWQVLDCFYKYVETVDPFTNSNVKEVEF